MRRLSFVCSCNQWDPEPGVLKVSRFGWGRAQDGGRGSTALLLERRQANSLERDSMDTEI